MRSSSQRASQRLKAAQRYPVRSPVRWCARSRACARCRAPRARAAALRWRCSPQTRPCSAMQLPSTTRPSRCSWTSIWCGQRAAAAAWGRTQVHGDACGASPRRARAASRTPLRPEPLTAGMPLLPSAPAYPPPLHPSVPARQINATVDHLRFDAGFPVDALHTVAVKVIREELMPFKCARAGGRRLRNSMKRL